MDIMNCGSLVVENVSLALYGSDPPGTVYNGYVSGRGCCGFVAVLGGEAEYAFADGRKKVLVAGDLALFSEKTAYIVRNTGEQPFPHYTVNFSLCPGCELPDEELYSHPAAFQNAARQCGQLLEYWRSQQPAAHFHCMGVLYELLAVFFEECALEKIGREAYRNVLPAIRYMDSRFQESIHIDGLAALCMMSRTGFRRTFTEVCGVSPIEYLLRIRMKRASELLTQSSLTVAEVAVACGFKDTEYFCRTFKKRTGMTAGQMRHPNKVSSAKERKQ